MKIRHIILLSAVLLFGACTKDDDSPIEESPREWYQFVSSDTISCSEIVKSITDIPITMNTWIVRVSFLYHSGFENGQVSLSGCVCWPVDCRSCQEIWLENHYTTSRWDECPTLDYEPGMLMCHTREKENAVYVSADYMGFGQSKDLPAPYFNSPLLAQQSIDCFKAALQIIKDNDINITSDFSTYNFGYSLGGSVSLGVAKTVELNPDLQKTVHLKKSFCGGGPYDQIAMTESYVKNSATNMEMPFVMALDAENLLNSHLVADIRGLFSDRFLESGVLEMVESKMYGTRTLDQVIKDKCGSTIAECLNPEILDTTSTMFRDFKAAHKAFDLIDGWEPTIPLVLFHSTTDGVVSYECMDNFRNSHKDNQVVTYVDYNDTHMNTGISFYKKIIGEIWMRD